MWTKTTLKEAERALLEVYRTTFTQTGMQRKFRRILHQLAYDAVAIIAQDRGWDTDAIATPMGIDLDLIKPE